MQTIAITTPQFYPGEAQAITRLLTNRGFSRVHIRKPDADIDRIRELIKQIPEELRPRLTIHNALRLAVELGLGGIHLNRHASAPPHRWQGLVSRSIHSIGEIQNLTGEDYAFISPVFPSISKPGYNPHFTLQQITHALSTRTPDATPLFALGGVTPERLPQLEAAGFQGAAMLAAAWQPQITPENFRLQFITHPTPSQSVVDGARKALEGGCRWIQLRWKDASQEQLLAAGREIAGMCRKHNATFIIDDHVELVHILDADGVHLGQNDMPVSNARAILGPTKIIGATANTLRHMTTAAAEGADYIGLGPFRFTNTKQNLSPVLGLQGYRSLLAAFTGSIPVVAIGGITDTDIPPLLSTGISGIALSSTILSDTDPAQRTSAIISILENAKKQQTQPCHLK